MILSDTILDDLTLLSAFIEIEAVVLTVEKEDEDAAGGTAYRKNSFDRLLRRAERAGLSNKGCGSEGTGIFITGTLVIGVRVNRGESFLRLE